VKTGKDSFERRIIHFWRKRGVLVV